MSTNILPKNVYIYIFIFDGWEGGVGLYHFHYIFQIRISVTPNVCKYVTKNKHAT